MESGGSTGAAASRTVLVEPSFGNALPYFAPLLIFPLVVLAALNGGWWFAGPFAFLALADKFDQMFGMQERNMDPDQTPESRLFVYKLSAWSWAVLWPVVFAFGLWQMLVAGNLAAWEIALLAVVLVLVGQTVFVVATSWFTAAPPGSATSANSSWRPPPTRTTRRSTSTSITPWSAPRRIPGRRRRG